MAEAAVAEVTIIPVSRGATRQIEQQLGGDEAGETVGRKVGSGLTSALGGALRGAATATVAAAAAGIGISLVKGFGRLEAIDTARAKLTGLGNDTATVEQVMGNALAAVKGTSFGLDAAATTAAGAVAAGIAPGSELERVLKSVANSAAAAGTGMDEMGSIYNKVASTNKAQNDVLQQVADRGIPIYQALASQLGVTTDEVFSMASAGKIGFAEFETAMTSAAGTVASEMGGTLGGSLDNFMSAIGRVGSGLLGGVFPFIAPLFQGMTSALGPLEEKAAQLGGVIGQTLAPAFTWITDKLAGSEGLFSGLVGTLSSLQGIVAPLAGAFAALGAGGLGSLLSAIPGIGGLAGPLAALGGPIGIVTGALIGLVSSSTELQSAFGGYFSTILSTVQGLFTQLAPVLQRLLPVVASLGGVIASVLAGAITTLTPVISEVISLFGNLLTSVLPLLIPIFELAGQVIGQIAAAVFPALSAILRAVMPLITTIADVIGQLLTPIMAALSPVIELVGGVLMVIANILGAVLPPVISFLIPIIQFLVTVLGGIITVVANIVSFIATALIALFTDWSTIWANISAFFIGVWEGIVSFFSTAWNGLVTFVQINISLIQTIIQTVLTTISGIWNSVWNGVSSFFIGIWNNIVATVGTFQGAFAAAFSGVASVVAGAFEGVAGIVKGAINGVIGIINGAIDGINVMIGVANNIPGVSIPAIGKIPKLAAGGIVSKRPGGILANIAEGRYDEAVVPLSPKNLEAMRGGGGNGEVKVEVLNKSGAALGDLIEMYIVEHDTRQRVSFENGIAR